MEWQQHTIYRREDDSYVIVKDGHPCHVPNEDEWQVLWQEISTWLDANGIIPTPEAQPYPPTLEEVRAAALETLRHRKWQAKDAGITVNGMAIDTDDRGQATISGAVLNVIRNPAFRAQWKTSAVDASGKSVWIEIGAAEINALADAMTAYTEACFTAEAAKQEQLTNLDSAEAIAAWLEEELDQGWPSREFVAG